RGGRDTTRARATADLWTEVRKALDATVIAKGSGLTFTMAIYRRELDAELTAKSSRADTLDTAAPRPFYAQSPAQLAQVGYVVKGDSGFTYFGPDEAVLLSNEFLTTHCFKISSRTDHGVRM